MQAHSFEFNGVVRLTRIGTTYVLGTCVLAVAALNTGNNAIYIGVSFMLGALLLSGIASKSGLRHLEVEAGAIDDAWAGRPAGGELRIRNRSRLWSVRDVVLVSRDLAQPVFVPLLPRRGEVVVAATLLFERRGVVELKTIDSYTRYPFGFFLKKRRLRIRGDVVVFPRLLDDEVAQELFRSLAGEQTSDNRPGAGTEIHSFRDYTRGDSLRHVYWKKSAGVGRWIMKQTEAESAREVHVVIDPYKPRSVSDDEFEGMISEAATFIHGAWSRGFEVTLSLPRTDVRVHERQWPAPLFRSLALLQAAHEPVHKVVGRNAVFFSAGGGRRDAKSA